MLEAVIFDLDGVIINSEPLMRRAFADSYRRVLGEGVPPIEDYLKHMGESFPRIMDKLGLPHTLWEPYREFCQTNIDYVTLFPECLELLERLSARKLKMAILTGKDYARTLHVLEHFRIGHYFGSVVASDQLRRPKPDPEGILRVLGSLDCPAEKAVMIGDSVSDILCGQQAGVPSIAVTWGIKPERVQTLCRPDHVVHDWGELTELLMRRLDGGGRAGDASASAPDA